MASLPLPQKDITKADRATVESKDYYGRSLIHSSAVEGNAPVVEKIITLFGPSVVWQEDVYKATPLHLAVRRSGNLEVVKCLLANGGSRLGLASDQCGNTAVSIPPSLMAEERNSSSQGKPP